MFSMKLTNLNTVTEEELLSEKIRLERILDNIANVSDGHKNRENIDDIAQALYFLLIIKLLGSKNKNKNLLYSKYYGVALKMINLHENDFHQVLYNLYQSLITIDNKAEFLDVLSKVLKTSKILNTDKNITSHFPHKIEEFKAQLASNAKAKTLLDENETILATLPASDLKIAYKCENKQIRQDTLAYCEFKTIYTDKKATKLFKTLETLNCNIKNLQNSVNSDESSATKTQVEKTQELSKYLPLTHQFSEDMKVLTVEYNNTAYQFNISSLNHEERFYQFISLRVLAHILATAFKDQYSDLITLSFSDFCNPNAPQPNANYQLAYHVLIHYFTLKEFLSQASIYMQSKKEDSKTLVDSYNTLQTYEIFATFASDFNHQMNHLNSAYSYNDLRLFVDSLQDKNQTTTRTLCVSSPSMTNTVQIFNDQSSFSQNTNVNANLKAKRY